MKISDETAREVTGKVLALYLSQKGEKTPIEKTQLEVNSKGIVGDKHYDTDSERSILITSLSSYTLAGSHDIDMKHSDLGENLLIDFTPYSMPVGTRFKIGTVILQLSQSCTLCNHLSKIDKRIPKLLKNDRGVFAKVISAGVINVGDTIYLID